ncbi:MAG: hypothetical protein AAF721_18725, partial [Myxococcota bacterium]
EAIVEALSPVAPLSCNDGFLRDDALLVITFLTDEEDDVESPGDPVTWKAAVLDAKGGNEDAVVVLGLLGDTGVAGGVCGFAEDAPRLRTFAESFTFGDWGSICSPSYAAFFDAAVEQIDVACEMLGPRG